MSRAAAGNPVREGDRPFPGSLRRSACALVALLLAVGPATAEELAAQRGVTLAAGGEARVVIATDPAASPAEELAASELASYLGRMSGAVFSVVTAPASGPAIVLRVDPRSAAELGEEGYVISTRADGLVLSGGSPRAVLYAAYDLLARLGCRWLAPELAFYEGAAEHVPHHPTLRWEHAGEVVERPVFALRKLTVEEGLTHDEANLRQIIAWMPKARFNTLQLPTDYQGSGRVRWDAWREALTPELDRRGLLIEVGGHGYQNFLNAEMEGGTLFERHPEWFGKDAECRRSPAPHLVFDTENPDAVAYLIGNVLAYLEARPEIDIFDFWPPDGARWAECPEMEALGTPQDRQTRLVNRLQAELERVRPDVRLEIIAYAHTKDPPGTETLSPAVLVDFCPIGQNFDVDLDDPRGANNALYVETIGEWARRFAGDLGIYTYYRRYAWRSLPNVMARYIARDLRWHAAVPMRAVSSYAEPGDWGTYEVNHYALGHLAWNPHRDVEALLDGHARARYGAAHAAAAAALAALEETVRTHGSIPYSEPRSATEIAAARAALGERAGELRAAAAGSPAAEAARARLLLMLDFAMRDLAIQQAKAEGAGEDDVRPRVAELVGFLEAHADRGVFLLRGRGDLDRYLRHYLRGIAPAAAPARAASE